MILADCLFDIFVEAQSTPKQEAQRHEGIFRVCEAIIASTHIKRRGNSQVFFVPVTWEGVAKDTREPLPGLEKLRKARAPRTFKCISGNAKGVSRSPLRRF